MTTNAGEILKRMERRRDSVTRELARAAGALAPLLQRESQKVLKDEIYSVEIPFRKSTGAATRAKHAGTSRQKVGGKQVRQWTRSGDLLRRERWRGDGPAIVGRNNSAHAVGRYVLGLAGHRKLRTPGVRSVQWHRIAVAKLRPRILKGRREAVLRAFGAR